MKLLSFECFRTVNKRILAKDSIQVVWINPEFIQSVTTCYIYKLDESIVTATKINMKGVSYYVNQDINSVLAAIVVKDNCYATKNYQINPIS